MFDGSGGYVQTGRQRDRLGGLKYWFGRGKVDWSTGKILEVMGPLSCRFKMGVDRVDVVGLGLPGVEYVRYMDDSGRILDKFKGAERALMEERVAFKL